MLLQWCTAEARARSLTDYWYADFDCASLNAGNREGVQRKTKICSRTA